MVKKEDKPAAASKADDKKADKPAAAVAAKASEAKPK